MVADSLSFSHATGKPTMTELYCRGREEERPRYPDPVRRMWSGTFGCIGSRMFLTTLAQSDHISSKAG